MIIKYAYFQRNGGVNGVVVDHEHKTYSRGLFAFGRTYFIEAKMSTDIDRLVWGLEAEGYTEVHVEIE